MPEPGGSTSTVGEARAALMSHASAAAAFRSYVGTQPEADGRTPLSSGKADLASVALSSASVSAGAESHAVINFSSSKAAIICLHFLRGLVRDEHRESVRIDDLCAVNVQAFYRIAKTLFGFERVDLKDLFDV